MKVAGAHVRYEAVKGVGWITLARPHVLNALDATLATDLAAAVARAEADPGSGWSWSPARGEPSRRGWTARRCRRGRRGAVLPGLDPGAERPRGHGEAGDRRDPRLLHRRRAPARARLRPPALRGRRGAGARGDPTRADPGRRRPPARPRRWARAGQGAGPPERPPHPGAGPGHGAGELGRAGRRVRRRAPSPGRQVPRSGAHRHAAHEASPAGVLPCRPSRADRGRRRRADGVHAPPGRSARPTGPGTSGGSPASSRPPLDADGEPLRRGSRAAPGQSRAPEPGQLPRPRRGGLPPEGGRAARRAGIHLRGAPRAGAAARLRAGASRDRRRGHRGHHGAERAGHARGPLRGADGRGRAERAQLPAGRADHRLHPPARRRQAPDHRHGVLRDDRAGARAPAAADPGRGRRRLPRGLRARRGATGRDGLRGASSPRATPSTSGRARPTSGRRWRCSTPRGRPGTRRASCTRTGGRI